MSAASTAPQAPGGAPSAAPGAAFPAEAGDGAVPGTADAEAGGGATRGWTREQMARLVAEDIPDGAYVNLGIGMPELVAQYVPKDREFIFQTENGLLGMGPTPPPGQEDPELINAGKKPVTAIPGAAFFHHADSFTMIRGGHIDVCVLGAMQVSERGDLANWSTGEPGAVPSVGGAMDLVTGVRRILVITEHTTKTGEPKIVPECTYPLTGRSVVDTIYTNLAIIDVTGDGLAARRLAPGVSFEEVRAATGARLRPPAGPGGVAPSGLTAPADGASAGATTTTEATR